MDGLSMLPDDLLGRILDKLPLMDRVKMNTLSRSWRLKPLLVSSLILDYEFYSSVPSFHMIPWEYAKAISNLLLQQGSCLQDLSLYIPGKPKSSVMSSFQPSIDHTTLKRLRLEGSNPDWDFLLPSFLFSAVNLRSLEIAHLNFFPPSWFGGFPNLTQFVLDSADTTVDMLTHFVSVCPKLQKLAFAYVYLTDQDASYKHLEQKLDLTTPNLTHLSLHGYFINLSISNAQNLESISMTSFCNSGVTAITSPEIFKLFKESLQLQHISLTHSYCQFLGSCSAIYRLPRFERVRSLKFTKITVHCPDQLRCLLSFCACSPDVRSLHLEIEWMGTGIRRIVGPFNLESMAEKYINRDLKNLVRVNVFSIHGQNIDKKIIQLLLCYSPVLEVMHIDFHCRVPENAKLQFIKAVTEFYRASIDAKVQFTSGAYLSLRR